MAESVSSRETSLFFVEEEGSEMKGLQYLERAKMPLPSFLLFSLKIIRATLEASEHAEDIIMGNTSGTYEYVTCLSRREVSC